MSLAFDEEIIGLFSEDSTCRQIIAILEVFGTTKFALELSLFARSVLHIARISNFERVGLERDCDWSRKLTPTS